LILIDDVLFVFLIKSRIKNYEHIIIRKSGYKELDEVSLQDLFFKRLILVMTFDRQLSFAGFS